MLSSLTAKLAFSHGVSQSFSIHSQGLANHRLKIINLSLCRHLAQAKTIPAAQSLVASLNNCHHVWSSCLCTEDDAHQPHHCLVNSRAILTLSVAEGHCFCHALYALTSSSSNSPAGGSCWLHSSNLYSLCLQNKSSCAVITPLMSFSRKAREALGDNRYPTYCQSSPWTRCLACAVSQDHWSYHTRDVFRSHPYLPPGVPEQCFVNHKAIY